MRWSPVMSAEPDTTPVCAHPGCRRDAEYRVATPDRPVTLRCRWHVDEAWRPHGAAATVTAIYGDAPPIDTTRTTRRPPVGALVLGALFVLVVLGFAALAPVLL